jgi:hypothetical protein
MVIEANLSTLSIPSLGMYDIFKNERRKQVKKKGSK